MKTRLRQIIVDVCAACCRDGLLHTDPLPDFSVEEPRSKAHGDLAANIAMVLARSEQRKPRDIAQLLAERLAKADPLISQVEVAGPGFLNFRLQRDAWQSLLAEIEAAAERYGAVSVGQGRRVLVEFVSANPTGPLHIGHGRGAAVGDALARVLDFAGYAVEREYYINDVGNQMNNLARSVYLRYCEVQGRDVVFPDDLYQGAYIYDLARSLVTTEGDRYLDVPEDQWLDFFRAYASGTILDGIRADLELFGVHFDTWFSEQQLYDRGAVQQSLDALQADGRVFSRDGALWFAATRYGDEKDRVVVRDDGRTTYFASDIAYHADKFSRGFDAAIDIWGADHHGYVPRIQAVLDALQIDRQRLGIVLVQMVNLLREGTPVAMSTRSGEFVTLREVIDEVGRDAARFIFLSRRSDAQLDFDLHVATQQSDENPVYYVQYAHARICSLISRAAERGLALPAFASIEPPLLAEAEEIDLIRKLGQLPETVAGSARTREPHRIAIYLMELVAQFHSYYNKHRVITDDVALSRARLHLMGAVRQVLRNGLALLGVQAPETM